MTNGGNPILDVDQVASLFGAAYGLEEATATLIRRGFNDSYQLEAGGARYVARVYLAGKYYLAGTDDIRYELAMLRHLAEQGVPVSTPLLRLDGDVLGELVDEAGLTRPFALFTWAPGGPLRESTDPSLPARCGRLLGQIHAASASFTSPYTRYRLDTSILVDQPHRQIGTRFAGPDEARFRAYDGVFDDMRAFLAEQPTELPWFGYVHGDPHGGNVHVDEGGQLTAFDFDHCALGWRADDVAVASGDLPEEHRVAFLEAYREVHPYAGDERSVEPWVPIRMLWDLGDMMAVAPVMGRTVEPSPQECTEFLDRVRERWAAATR